MSDTCCNIRYEAFDGKTFKTQEECKAYNDIPRVWIVSVRYSRENVTKDKFIYLTKELAEEYLQELGQTDRIYASIYSKPIITTHPPRFKEKHVSKPSWFSQLFNYKGDDT